MVYPESLPKREKKNDFLEEIHEKEIEKKADDFLGRSLKDQLNELGYEEIDEKQHKHAESLGLSDEDYLRRRGVVNRLDLYDFDPRKNPSLSKEKMKETRDEHDLHEMILGKIRKEDIRRTPKEQEEIMEALERAMAVDESIEALASNPEAEQEMYILLRKRSVGTIDDEKLIEGVDEISRRYEFIPPAAISPESESHDETSAVAKATEAEVEAVTVATGVEAGNILGKNRHGDLLIQMVDSKCGFDPGSQSINWVRININGHEFKYEGDNERDSSPELFQKELGIARAQAIFAYYKLPFDMPTQENLIELFLNKTGDTQEFQFQDFTPDAMEQMNRFLADLKPTASQGAENETQSWRSLGILNNDNTLNHDRYKEIAKEWMKWKKITTHHSFLEFLEDKT